MSREDRLELDPLNEAEDGQKNKYLTFLLAEEY